MALRRGRQSFVQARPLQIHARLVAAAPPDVMFHEYSAECVVPYRAVMVIVDDGLWMMDEDGRW